MQLDEPSGKGTARSRAASGLCPSMTSLWPMTLGLREGTVVFDFTGTVERSLPGKLWGCADDQGQKSDF